MIARRDSGDRSCSRAATPTVVRPVSGGNPPFSAGAVGNEELRPTGWRRIVGFSRRGVDPAGTADRLRSVAADAVERGSDDRDRSVPGSKGLFSPV
ncbi:hypothetical protein C478_13440 [Natrinema thermotolerans DSM 11552]|nr:hypothetical protein C478_13440 [Natrinema thermotolerans DSM 11552]